MQVREDGVVLFQVVSVEDYLYLALGGLVPVMTARIETEVPMDLQVRIVRRALVVVLEVDSMIWFSKRIRFYLIHICLLTMRTESILYVLVWDVISALNSHSVDGETDLGVPLRATTVSSRPRC